MAYVKVADRVAIEETNGAGKLTRLALQKKLAYYEKAAEACRFILAQFDDTRSASTLDTALAIDQVRRHTTNTKNRTNEHQQYLHRKATRETRRQETARVLKSFSKTEPRSAKGAGRGTGALLRNGYIKKTADGLFLRTDKVFTV